MATEKKSALSAWRDYIIQVSLIILSILIALGVDRCSQNMSNAERLNEYLDAMEEEMEHEAYSTLNNIGDADKDVNNLQFGMNTFPKGVDSLTEKALQRVLSTFIRGVFRAFPPMTYERMAATNDAFLIKDLTFRERLASTASFRTDYVQADLNKYDALVLEAIDRFGRYVDIGCLIRTKAAAPLDCVTDKDALQRNGAADLSKLYHLAGMRRFHLDRYQQHIFNAQTALAEFRGELAPQSIEELAKPAE